MKQVKMWFDFEQPVEYNTIFLSFDLEAWRILFQAIWIKQPSITFSQELK